MNKLSQVCNFCNNTSEHCCPEADKNQLAEQAKRERELKAEDEQGISAFELKPVFNTNPDLDKISGILLQQLEPQLPRELSRLEILQIALQAEQEKIALECKVN